MFMLLRSVMQRTEQYMLHIFCAVDDEDIILEFVPFDK